MAVFRVERNKGYTVMSNHHLRNKELSLKAKGLLSQMLSLPEDWDYTLAGLSFINREKIDAIREAVKELERAGYIVRSRERDEKGRLRGADYVIFEQPQTPPVSDLPTLENPTLDNPTLEKPTQKKPTLENPTQLNKDIHAALWLLRRQAAARFCGRFHNPLPPAQRTVSNERLNCCPFGELATGYIQTQCLPFHRRSRKRTQAFSRPSYLDFGYSQGLCSTCF